MSDLFPEVKPGTVADADRRYTPKGLDYLCRQIAGVEQWDLDVAADSEAHLSPNFFDLATNGLRQWWWGRVWCNPPYSDLWPWVDKAWAECRADRAQLVAMLLPGNRAEQPWWQELVEPWRDRRRRRFGFELTSHFLPMRQKFGHPGNREAKGVAGAPFPSVLLVWRRPHA